MAAGFIGGVIVCCNFTTGMLGWQLSVWAGKEYLAEFSILSGKNNVLLEKLLLPDGYTSPDGGRSKLWLCGIHDE